MANLVFRSAPASSGDLLFGEVESYPDLEALIVGPLPGLSGAFEAGYITEASIAGVLPGLAGSTTWLYDTAVDRPLVNTTRAAHQDARPVEAGVDASHTAAVPMSAVDSGSWGAARPVEAPGVPSGYQDTHRLPAAASAAHQDARRATPAPVSLPHQDGARDRRATVAAAHQDARRAPASAASPWQERIRAPRPRLIAPWGTGRRVHRGRGEGWTAARPRSATRSGRYQEAVVPGPGRWAGPPPPPFDPCYLPDPNLYVESEAATTSWALRFWCERHAGPVTPEVPALVVVPIRGIYIVNNTITLTRLPTGTALPVLDFSLNVDADSWTWSFSASLPYAAAATLQPTGAEPTEVMVEINSVGYRLVVERMSTERRFREQTVRISGRGRNALLAAPYAPVKGFSSIDDLTAQQLMNAALADEGSGWSLQFLLDDWTVPAGAWAHQGTWLTAVTTIAGAAGGYVQPHRTDRVLRVLPRYPSAPWDWGTASPDYDLPSSVVEVETIEWEDKPDYDRVFVVGERGGIVGQVTRTGAAGSLVAPTVVDALITGIPAARQRGLAVLGDTGRQASVNLSLPVLSETGVIPPGALVRYLDGPTARLGLVRTTAVSGGLSLRQTLGIETHVAA